jgi:hypothetical protein
MQRSECATRIFVLLPLSRTANTLIRRPKCKRMGAPFRLGLNGAHARIKKTHCFRMKKRLKKTFNSIDAKYEEVQSIILGSKAL